MVLQTIFHKKYVEGIVSRAYNKMALQYTKIFKTNPNYLSILKQFTKSLPEGSKVLDAGCGTGIPVAKFLSKRFGVIGIDISSKMIRLARKNVPLANFKRMSMTNITFKPRSFDMVCSFFALFHVKKSNIPLVLRKFYSLLRERGHLILSLGESKEDIEKLTTFFKETIYYAATSKKHITKLLRKSGFTIIFCDYLNHKYKKNGKHFNDNELFIVARK